MRLIALFLLADGEYGYAMCFLATSLLFATVKFSAEVARE